VTEPLPEDVLLGRATEAEGHADTAAPALVGGLTSVVEGPDGAVALRWTWPDGLRLIVATPDMGLATEKARAALPDLLPRKDAVYNLQRVLSLVHALQSGDDARLREALHDRWHQPARAGLVPLLGEVLALEDPDVLGAFLSGAGPSTAVLARREFSRLVRLLSSLYERGGCPATVRTLGVHQGSNVMAGASASAAGSTR
jgi:homoserine kinase